MQVAITKRGDRLEVDFSGTSRQARTCINATALDVKTTVGVAVKYLLDPRGAFTSGLYRNIDIVLPEGTVDQRAAARRRGVRLLRAEPGDALRAAARVRRRAGRGRHRPATAAAPTSTTPSACGPTGRRGSRRPSAAARSARSAPRATATARRRCSPTRPTAWRPRSEAIEADVPVVMLRHEPLPDSARSRAPPRRRGDGARHAVDRARRAPPDVAARQARRRASGCRAGGDGRAGRRVGLRPAGREGAGRSRARSPRPTARPRRWPASSIPRPTSSIPTGDYVYPFPPAGHATRARRDPALRQHRRRRVGRPARSATPRRSSATCATATSRSRAPRATTASSIDAAIPTRIPRA